jgi:hypothetical protein
MHDFKVKFWSSFFKSSLGFGDSVPKKLTMCEVYMENFDENLIVLGEEAPAPAQEKIPWVTVVILACLCVFSVVTGLVYWYGTYVRTVRVEPVHLEVAETPSQEESPQNGEYVGFDDLGESGEEVLLRPEIEIPPEFVALRQYHGNDEIVGVLRIAGEEVLVTQSEESQENWHFVAQEADLFWGLDHNIVIHATAALREVLQQYMADDFFLIYPMMELDTIYGPFEWEIFSFYVAPADFPFGVVNHENDDIWGDVVEQFTLASLHNMALDVNMYDQILTVSTPTAISNDLFYVLQARMLRQITS